MLTRSMLRIAAVFLAAFIAALRPCAAETLLRIGISADPGTLDPQKTDLAIAYDIDRDLWEGLIDYDPTLHMVPGAAASWDVSPDGLTYVFHLRAGLLYSNGEKVRAADFVYGLQRYVDPAVASPSNENLRAIVNADDIIAGRIKDPARLGAEAPDDRTLILHLAHPSAVMTQNATGFYPVRRADIEKWGGDWTQPGKLVTNGAFTLGSRVPQSSVELVRNANFRDAAGVRLDRVRYAVVPDQKTAMNQFRTGDLDVAELPADEQGWARETLGSAFRSEHTLAVTEIAFNEGVPPFKDNPKLRRALALAIDQATLVRSVRRTDDEPAYAFLAPVIDSYPPVAEDFRDLPMAARLAEAKSLYAAAGYGPDKPLALTLLVTAADDTRKIATAVAAMWHQALGVTVTLDEREFQIAMGALTRRDFTVALDRWIYAGVPTPRLLEVFRSTLADNETQYSNAAFDTLLDKADAALDWTAQNQAYAEAERLMLADQPIVPLYFHVDHYLVAPALTGWEPNAGDIHPSRFIAFAPR